MSNDTVEIDYLLNLAMEEAAEVIVACSKARRFGIAHDEPGYGHNGHRIACEFGHLICVYDHLVIRGSGCLPLSMQSLGYGDKDRWIRAWLGANAK